MDNENRDSNKYTEEHTVTGEKLVDTIKELIHEGNVRHIIIKNDTGTTIFEIPLAIGVVGIVLLPVLAAVGAIAVLAANYKIVVVRENEPPKA